MSYVYWAGCEVGGVDLLDTGMWSVTHPDDPHLVRDVAPMFA